MRIKLYHHLLAHGWKQDTLRKYILDSNTKLQNVPIQFAGHQNDVNPRRKPTTLDRLFFHLPYHPNDIPQCRIQQLYQQHCHAAFTTIGIDRLTVAYSRPKNLRVHLTQARLHQARGKEASKYYYPHDIGDNNSPHSLQLYPLLIHTGEHLQWCSKYHGDDQNTTVMIKILLQCSRYYSCELCTQKSQKTYTETKIPA